MNHFAESRRRAKATALLEVIDYVAQDLRPLRLTADDVAAWNPAVWRRLLDAANALLEPGETPFGVPSQETKKLVIAELRARESAAVRRAVAAHTERVVEPIGRNWA